MPPVVGKLSAGQIACRQLSGRFQPGKLFAANCREAFCRANWLPPIGGKVSAGQTACRQLSADLKSLKRGELFLVLKGNGFFASFFANRILVEAGKEYIDSKLAREKLSNSYESFVGYVFFKVKLKGDEFITVLNVLNATRKYYANLLAIREGKKDAKKNKGEEGNDPTQNPGS